METNQELQQRAITAIESLNQGSADADNITALTDDLLQAMAKDPQTRGMFGQLVGKLRSLSKAQQNSTDNTQWIKVGDGHLAIGSRPKIKSIEIMRRNGLSHVFTLQCEQEGAKEIGRATQKSGLQWLWLSLESAVPPTNERTAEIQQLFNQIKSALQDGAKIYIHCAAGIHRTGMITYALLRYLGYDVNTAKTLLAQLRTVTSEEVGQERLLWGNSFVPS